MSRCWHRQILSTPGIARGIFNPRIIHSILIALILTSTFSIGNPLPVEPLTSLPKFNQSSTTVESLLNDNASNTTTNDLYVIRAVVYEIGILTDVDNSTDEATERHEEVKLSFYDPPHQENGLLDLSGIPVPKVVAASTDKNNS